MYKETFKIFVVLVLTAGLNMGATAQVAEPEIRTANPQDSDIRRVRPTGLQQLNAVNHLLPGAYLENNVWRKMGMPGGSVHARTDLTARVFNGKSNLFYLPAFSTALPENSSAPMAVQQDLYVKGFGFFCKKEMQVEKITRIPFRLRLGSLEQCNVLEQKY